MTGFAELVAATNYSFLRGASHPSDMVSEAMRQKMRGIGIADRNTVAGVVRAHVALRDWRNRSLDAWAKDKLRHEAGHPWEPFPDPPEQPVADPDFRLVVGARLVFRDGTPDIVAYPATRYGWGRLTRLLTAGNRRAAKGGCLLDLGDLIAHHEDLLLIVLTKSSFDEAEVKELAGKRRVAEEQDRGFLELGDEEAEPTNIVPFPTRHAGSVPAFPEPQTTAQVVEWTPAQNPRDEGLDGTLPASSASSAIVSGWA